MTEAEEVAQLSLCNESELLDIARIQGLGILRSGISQPRLIAIVRGESQPELNDYGGIQETRKKLQDFIETNMDRIRNQLPGCNGRCVTFPCSSARHAMCFMPNVRNV